MQECEGFKGMKEYAPKGVKSVKGWKCVKGVEGVKGVKGMKEYEGWKMCERCDGERVTDGKGIHRFEGCEGNQRL